MTKETAMTKATKDKIEILVVNHKPSYVPANSLLKPIQVGTALGNNKLDHEAYYDNDGDNISLKNRSYNELTATYWAWKNIDADYYGLFHYRRYLSFSSEQKRSAFGSIAYDSVQSAVGTIGLDDEDNMRKTIKKYDLILPRREKITGAETIYEQYKIEHNISDLDYCLEYIEKHYPVIAPYTNAIHSDTGYFYNMFIMKKELFHDYAAFMFDVLDSFEENNDISGYGVYQYRVTGFIAERIGNIYMHYLQSKKGIKYTELQTSFFENTNPEPKIEPIAKKDNIAVVLAANNFYVPYISTLLHSVAEHANKTSTYDINIFHQDITPDSMNVLKKEFKDYPNINIRFCDMSSRASQYSKLFTKWHFTVETYFRLFIQDIMAGYRKVLYLDGDMIVREDIANLFNEDVSKHLLAAVRDVDMAGVYNSNVMQADNTIDPKRKDYIENELKIERPYDYFQAGVILFNLDEMRKSFNTEEALEFAASRQWEYLDQDVLNFFAQGNVKYLDPSWNVLYDWEFTRINNVIAKAPIDTYLQYMESRKNPKIIHYGGTVKPWQRPDCDFGYEYWRVARNSAYYELIVGRMSEWRVMKSKEAAQVSLKPTKSNIVSNMRRVADRVAPKGTVRRGYIKRAADSARKVKHAIYKNR
jgi:lipopolysaccharide biosynthesis glycosyltransferase